MTDLFSLQLLALSKNRLSRYLHSFLESEVLPPNTPLSQSINMC
jgi:hypothetical protein